MNRADLQQLSKLRIKEAKVLLDNGYYTGAYYLAGYAVECALKACIAKQTKRYDFPDKDRVNRSYVHKLEDLLKLAGLEADWKSKTTSNSTFLYYWQVVKDWNEDVRYRPVVSQAAANDLYTAITNRQNGVLPWLRKYW